MSLFLYPSVILRIAQERRDGETIPVVITEHQSTIPASRTRRQEQEKSRFNKSFTIHLVGKKKEEIRFLPCPALLPITVIDTTAPDQLCRFHTC